MAVEGSVTVPAITLDLVPEVKSVDESDQKVEKIANCDTPQKTTFKVASSASEARFVRSSSIPSFSYNMSGPKPSTSSPLRASFLRPPQLASPEKFGASAEQGESSPSKCSFALKPARLNNPFAKAAESEDAEDNEATSGNTKPSNSSAPVPQPSSSLPKFVPLGTPLPPSQQRVSPAPPPAAATTSSAASGYVFGQNLHERVSDAANAESTSEKKELPEAVNNGASVSGTNGTTENLFTSVLKKEHGEKSNDSGGEGGGERPSKSLSEAAKEYEESRAVKRKYDEVVVVTGEEDELNILQINCKLFAFDKVKSAWVERGRGNLRLNDKEIGTGQKQSRVIMRATGSLRVVLNTKLWPGMVVEKVSSKSVRLTAMDANSGEILVFLIMASPKDADFLYNYMESRVASLKASCAESASSYPDVSRKSNSSAQPNKCDDFENTEAKKRAVERTEDDNHTNHSSKLPAESRDSQDTGGSDDSSLGKNSDVDVSNSAEML